MTVPVFSKFSALYAGLIHVRTCERIQFCFGCNLRHSIEFTNEATATACHYTRPFLHFTLLSRLFTYMRLQALTATTNICTIFCVPWGASKLSCDGTSAHVHGCSVAASVTVVATSDDNSLVRFMLWVQVAVPEAVAPEVCAFKASVLLKNSGVLPIQGANSKVDAGDSDKKAEGNIKHRKGDLKVRIAIPKQLGV